MPFQYHHPNNVISPKAIVSNIQVIFDGGTGSNPFSVVKLDWYDKPRIAMRWNVAEHEWDDLNKQSGQVVCMGLPVSRGYPVWFILPDDFLDTDSDVWKTIKKKLKDFDGK